MEAYKQIRYIYFAIIEIVVILAVFFVTIPLISNRNERLGAELSETIASFDQTLYEIGLIDVHSSMITIVDGERNIQTSHSQVSLDPYYINIENDDFQELIFMKNDRFYRCKMWSTDDENKTYYPFQIDENEASSYGLYNDISNIESSVNIELKSIVKYIDGSFRTVTTFEELIKVDMFREFSELYNGLTESDIDRLNKTPVNLDFLTVNGIGISVEFSFKMEVPENLIDVYNKERVKVKIMFSINMIPSVDEQINIFDEYRFVTLEHFDILKAPEIELDEVVDVPYNVHNMYDFTYYKIYLEQGHYGYHSNLKIFKPTFYKVNENVEALSINIYDNPILNGRYDEELRTSLYARTSGYYYVCIFDNDGREDLWFTIERLNYDDYASEESVLDVTSGGSYDYQIEGIYDILKFVKNDETSKLVEIKGITENMGVGFDMSSYVIRNAYYANDSCFFPSGTEVIEFYLFYKNNYNEPFEGSLEVIMHDGNFASHTKLGNKTNIYDEYDEEIYLLGFDGELSNHYVNLVIDEPGEYVFEMLSEYQNTILEGVLYDEYHDHYSDITQLTNNPYKSNSIYLEAGEYTLEIYSVFDIVKLKYTKTFN